MVVEGRKVETDLKPDEDFFMSAVAEEKERKAVHLESHDEITIGGTTSQV